jgi:hypothetical protein
MDCGYAVRRLVRMPLFIRLWWKIESAIVGYRRTQQQNWEEIGFPLLTLNASH